MFHNNNVVFRIRAIPNEYSEWKNYQFRIPKQAQTARAGKPNLYIFFDDKSQHAAELQSEFVTEAEWFFKFLLFMVLQ